MDLIAGWSSPVARQAHNLKAAGSNPAPATNFFIPSFENLKNLKAKNEAVAEFAGVLRELGQRIREISLLLDPSPTPQVPDFDRIAALIIPHAGPQVQILPPQPIFSPI